MGRRARGVGARDGLARGRIRKRFGARVVAATPRGVVLGVKGDETRDEHDDEDAEEGDAGAEVGARVLGVWEETRTIGRRR